MFLHVGNNKNIRLRSVVGIFDMDNATWSRWTRDALNRAETAGEVVNGALEEIPNAFLLCQEKGKQKIYLSMLTSQTLMKRAEESVF